MVRRILTVLAVGVAALAPTAFAQDDIEGVKQIGIENAKELPGEVLLRLGFTFARADVPETVRLRLDAVAAVLNGERSAAAIDVVGHTDSVGNEAYNQALSERRAASVKAYLVARGVDENRISVSGYGETLPRATNDTVEGRRLNRRVEIRVNG
ncbi:MAG: OmpA family protein [Gammaproteobacteria bacterium]